jgi:hypothetical protein
MNRLCACRRGLRRTGQHNCAACNREAYARFMREPANLGLTRKLYRARTLVRQQLAAQKPPRDWLVP